MILRSVIKKGTEELKGRTELLRLQMEQSRESLAEQV